MNRDNKTNEKKKEGVPGTTNHRRKSEKQHHHCRIQLQTSKRIEVVITITEENNGSHEINNRILTNKTNKDKFI